MAALRGQLRALANDRNLRRFVVQARPTGRQLGTGSYGTVEEVEVNGLLCAGKKIHEILLDVGNVGVREVAAKYVQECQLMSDLRHPNITQFLGLCFLPTCQLPVLVMERLDGSLDDLLDTVPNIPLPLKRSMLEDVARGLLYLHKHDPQIIHRDLTAKNVLLTSSLVAKITDLGNSRIVNIQPGQLAQTLSRNPGTLVYMPPEALTAASRYGPSLDIFSFGHLGIFVGLQIFPGDLLEPTYADPENRGRLLGRSEEERRQKYFEQLEENYPRGGRHPFIQLVKRCLKNEPLDRPTAEEVITSLEEMKADIEGPCGNVARIDAVRQVVTMREILGRETEVRRKTDESAAKDEEIHQLQEELEHEQAEQARSVERMSSQLQQKDAEIHQKVAELQLIRTQLQEKDTQIHKKEAELEVARAQLQQKDRNLRAEQAKSVERMSSQLQQKDAEIHQKVTELQLIRTQLQEKDTQIHKREAELEVARTQLQQKDRNLQSLCAELEARDAQLRAKQEEVKQRDTEISRLTAELRRCQELLRQQSASVSALKNIPSQVQGETIKQTQLTELKLPLKLSWKRGIDMPFAMSESIQAVYIVIGDNVYVGGGYCTHGDYRKATVMVYSLRTESWRNLPLCETSHRQFGMAAVNDQLVLVGGRNTTGNRSSVLVAWDEVLQIWTHPFPEMPTPRSSPSVASYQNWLIVAGGYDERSYRLNKVELLDTLSGQWYEGSPLPDAYSSMSSAINGNMWYLSRGYSAKGARAPNKHVFSVCLDELISQAVSQSADTSSRTPSPWQTLTDPPLTESTVLVLNGALLTVGGSKSSAIHLYQPSRQTWVKIGDLPVEQWQCACTVLPSGAMFVAGGHSEHFTLSSRVDICTIQSI